MKSASCTTTSLFIVIFSKNSFFFCSLELDDRQRRRSFSKADAKVRGFSETRKCFWEKVLENMRFFFCLTELKEKKGGIHYILYTGGRRYCSIIYRREEVL